MNKQGTNWTVQDHRNVAALNSFLNPVGSTADATAALRAQRAQQWNNFIANQQSKNSGRR